MQSIQTLESLTLNVNTVVSSYSVDDVTFLNKDSGPHHQVRLPGSATNSYDGQQTVGTASLQA